MRRRKRHVERRGRLRLEPVERVAQVRERRGHFDRGRQHRDESHVGEVVVRVVEAADVLRGHRADRCGMAARREGERMRFPVERSPDVGPHPVPGLRRARDHLLVDGSLLVELERAVRCLRDAVVVHLAADLLVRVVGVQVRIEVVLEGLKERRRIPRRVEVVRRLDLIRERGRLDERHLLPAAEAAALVPFSEEQVLLRMRLASIRIRRRADPEVPLRAVGMRTRSSTKPVRSCTKRPPIGASRSSVYTASARNPSIDCPAVIVPRSTGPEGDFTHERKTSGTRIWRMRAA
jgi:hypothetical protein